MKAALNMARRLWLTDIETGKIDALLKEDKGVAAIARKIGRSETAVRNYSRRKSCGVKRKKAGRPEKLSSRNKRALVKMAKRPGMTASKVKAVAGLDVSERTVQRALSSFEFLHYGHAKPRHKLDKRHVRLHLQ